MIYTINNTRIMCQTRCGHTSMLEWLGLKRNDEALQTGQQAHLFTSTPVKQLVIVLRNPYDRLLSAMRNTKIHEARYKQNMEPISKKLKYQSGWFTQNSGRSVFQHGHEFTMEHARPFLKIAVPRNSNIGYAPGGNPHVPSNLKHINFYRLNEYMPVGQNTVPTSKSDGLTEYLDGQWNDGMSEYYSKEVMLNEHEAYLNLLNNTEEMTVEEWLKVNGFPKPLR